jgi:hypothetical protein
VRAAELVCVSELSEDDRLLRAIDTDESAIYGVCGNALSGKWGRHLVDQFKHCSHGWQTQAVNDPAIMSGGKDSAVLPEPA